VKAALEGMSEPGGAKITVEGEVKAARPDESADVTRSDPTKKDAPKDPTAPAAKPRPVISYFDRPTAEGKHRVWNAHDSETGDEIADAQFTPEGEVEMNLDLKYAANKARPDDMKIRGTEVSDALLAAMKGDKTPMRAKWGKARPDNLREFNARILGGEPAEAAAANTWTGRRCRDRGLAKVRIDQSKSRLDATANNGTYFYVEVVFE
jgi:hypothetical protein